MPDVPSNGPGDPIDPYESRLARRVGRYADRAVQPIDAGEIARTVAVAVGAGRRPVAGRLLGPSNPSRRFVLIGVAALVGVVAIGAAIGSGGRSLFAPAPTPTAAVAARPCTPNDVDAKVTAWDGAAGSRIATVELRQVGVTPCAIDPNPQPWLADGHGHALIVGKAGTGKPIEIAPGDVLQTLVDVSNYCGPDPVAPVTVAFTEGAAVFVATALTATDLTGVPPCNSAPGSAGSIQMHPFAPGAPS